jgi:Flp pilus assembly protein TadG
MTRRIPALLARLRACQSGLSAVEFALILPAMVTVFFGIGEITSFVQASNRMTKVAASIADLVAQDSAIDDAEMADILLCADAIMQPFPAGTMSVRVTSVVADASGTTTVEWSDARNTTERSTGSSITVPNGVVSPGMGVILTEVSYTYTSSFGMFLTQGIEATDSFYARPRRSTKVARL